MVTPKHSSATCFLPLDIVVNRYWYIRKKSFPSLLVYYKSISPIPCSQTFRLWVISYYYELGSIYSGTSMVFSIVPWGIAIKIPISSCFWNFPIRGVWGACRSPSTWYSGPWALTIVWSHRDGGGGVIVSRMDSERERYALLISTFSFSAPSHKVKGSVWVLVASTPLSLCVPPPPFTYLHGARQKDCMALHSARAGFKCQPHHFLTLQIWSPSVSSSLKWEWNHLLCRMLRELNEKPNKEGYHKSITATERSQPSRFITLIYFSDAFR